MLGSLCAQAEKLSIGGENILQTTVSFVYAPEALASNPAYKFTRFQKCPPSKNRAELGPIENNSHGAKRQKLTEN